MMYRVTFIDSHRYCLSYETISDVKAKGKDDFLPDGDILDYGIFDNSVSFDDSLAAFKASMSEVL